MRRIGKGFLGVDSPLFDDVDEDVTLVDAEEDMNADIQGRLAESQAKVYHLDLQHAEKVLSMQDTDKTEPAEVEEVIEVVTAAKLMIEVVTTTATTITVAQVPKCMRTRRSYFPPTATIPRRSRKHTTNVVEPEIRTIVEMADNRTIAQMLQAPFEGYEDAIVVPPINANNFELKQTLINLVQSNQFTRRQDPHNHL
nr:reverse transcriptase domain-containing protein [Tanacetum cinerariifolium]